MHCNPSAKGEQDGDGVNRNSVTSCCHMHTPHADDRELLVLNWIQVVVSRLPYGVICLRGQVS